MKTPKIVGVDLLYQAHKRKSPNKKSPNKYSSTYTSPYKTGYNKNSSKQKQQQQEKRPTHEYLHKGAGGLFKSRSKQRDYSSRDKKYLKDKYSQILYKMPIHKLKQQLFSNIQMYNDEYLTKKTLKRIGEEAKYRSFQLNKNKHNNDKSRPQHNTKVPIQIYQPYNHTKSLYYSLKDDKYLQIYKNHLLYYPKKHKHSPSKRRQVYYDDGLSSDSQSCPSKLYPTSRPSTENRSKKYLAQFQQFQDENFYASISQDQIECICEIYSFCEKYQQDSTLTFQNFYNLLGQLQRLYSIKLTENQIESSSSFICQQNQFSKLLFDFEEKLKIIFYRSTQNNIYDCLYHLSQSRNIKEVCKTFRKIKSVLRI